MPTRAELKTLFRSIIDDQGQNQIFSDSRIEALLYEGAQEVQSLLEDTDSKYNVLAEDINVTGEALTIPINPNLNRLISVKRVDVSPYIEFEEVDYRELPRIHREYGDSNRDCPKFALINNELRYPSGLGIDHTLRIEYTAFLQNLTADAQEWSGIPRFAHRLIAYEAALIGLIAEDSDARQLTGIISSMRAKVTARADNRSSTGPRYVNYQGEYYA